MAGSTKSQELETNPSMLCLILTLVVSVQYINYIFLANRNHNHIKSKNAALESSNPLKVQSIHE